MRKKRFNLLSKALFFYLVLTLVTVLIGALILQREADKHMHRILENRFRHREHWIERVLEKTPDKLHRSKHTSVTELAEIPSGFEPVYSDTLLNNEYTQREQIYRKKITYLEVNGRAYKLEMINDADELYRFRDDVFHIVLPVLFVLVAALFLANYLLSGYLLDPFRKILKQMATYKIGQAVPVEPIRTSTYEFDKLKQLYETMRCRIESDYFQLKEYTENMSHELQTPLSIIQNKSESLLTTTDLDEEHMRSLKTIYDETVQLSRLGKALNLITRIENQEFQNIQNLPTGPVIEDHIDRVKEMADMKSIIFDKELDESHSLQIDPGLLDIMLRNLIKNAIRNAPGGTSIEVRTTGSTMEFINEGEPADFPEEKIFDRFRKGSGQHTLGLGLAIVRRICEISGLEIVYRYVDGKHRFMISGEQ